MTNQEYYENHFLIEGETPPQLRDWQKKLFELYDLAENDPEIEAVVVSNGRKAGYGILFKSIEAKMKFEGKQSLHEYVKGLIKTEAPYGCE